MKSLKLLSKLALLSALLAAPAMADTPAAAATAQWAIDSSHMKVGFSVRHMMVSDTEGVFRTMTGTVLLDEADLTKSSVEISIDVASIDTAAPDRDKHLKSPDFFDVEKFPTITFKSTKIKKAGKLFKVSGDLTMHGVTKPVTLDVELSQAVTNPWGKQVRGVRVKGELDRQDFGVSWNKGLDKGGVVVGDKVQLDIRFELNR